MFGEKLLITKYPYLGYSENLIEYFSIVGYTQNFIPELISAYKQNQICTINTNNSSFNNQKTLKNKNPYLPTVLSSITSKTDYGIVDNELIITQLYPENPKIFISEINQPEPEKANIIYSFCFDSSDGKKKVFYTCFGYKFYELYKEEKSEEEYYIPKAFCIVSQYPFFNTFYLICKNLYNMLTTKSNKIPFEILVYNIINYIPSPINSNLELDLFSNDNESQKIEINQLNGYPNIDFDLFEIFNLLPLNLILEVYMLTFLEQSILFFSSNLEILNIVMYIMYMFNYPCNDSTYFWHIVSVDKNNLIEENKFVGKIMISLLGVNSAYNEDIDTFAFSNYHYIVDIDNKKLHFRESLNISIDEREEMNKLIQLVNFIENIFKDKNTNSHFLKHPLVNLKNHLEDYLSENIINYNPNPKKNVVNFFKDEIKNLEMTKKILEFFYDCNLTLLTKFYNDNELNTSFDKIVKEEGNNFDDSIASIKSYSDEEKVFLDIVRSTVKYKIYFDNFMQDFEAMEVFKIPFLFSEIFIELKIKDQTRICCDNLNYFTIIEHLYKLGKKSILKKINFNSFNQHYIESLSKYFKKFYISDFDNNIFDKNENNKNMNILNKPKIQLINLNKKIINKYMYLLQNFYEKHQIEDLFPNLKIKEDRIIKIIDRRLIHQLIKNKLIENKFISSLNFLIYSLIYVVSLTITFHPFQQMVTYLLEIQKSLKLINFFMRDYIYTLIKSIYKYYLINRQSKKFPTMTLSHVKMYFCILANFIRQKFLVPNEEMMIILKNFFSEIIFQERKELNITDEENKSKINILYNNISNNNEDLYKTKEYILFMKYCFSPKGIYKSKTMVDRAMEELGNCNVIIKNNKKISNPKILIKIKEYIYTCRFFSPQKLCKDAENLFEDLFDNYNMDFLNLNIQKLREIILNLILYGSELEDEPIPVGFLINTLYILRDFEKYYYIKEKND